ncbi:peptidoglycan-binding protein [Lysobacter sp. GCM10012299]|uniref:peptidoglycan-binding protein n=1 Tax=Lysobacter sp. GCM10012299 TaxID=3317333 RepID=UPI00360B1DCC
MSASAPIDPHDPLGLDAPFAEGVDEADRFGAALAWTAQGESPYAESPYLESPYAEATDEAEGRTADSQLFGPTEESLAWLDTESEGGDTQALAEDLALNGEDATGLEYAREWQFDASTGEAEYLDDEERDAQEAFVDSAPQYDSEQTGTAAPAVAPLSGQQRAWILDTERSAIERLPDAATRQRLLQQDWSGIEFPGNAARDSDPAEVQRQTTLARGLFAAIARIAPERRVPRTIRFRDRPAHPVPGQSGHRLYAEARDAFVRMRDAAQKDGVKLAILSSWRSPSHQAKLSANQRNPNAVARGISAHMYGLAIDLRMSVPALLVLETCTRGFEKCTSADRANPAKAGLPTKMANLVRMYRSPVYKWMLLRARDFGWYPYRNEPWHWEYNPPGLKARFEADVAQESESAGEDPFTEAELQDLDYEYVPQGEARCSCQHEEETAPSGQLRTFTAKALGVKVAVLVTTAAQAAREVEMLVFAHGLDLCRPLRKDRPATFVTDPPFRLGQLVEASGRPIVLVVPFLDWERLEANGMAFGKKWHRLAEPAVFNQVAEEVLEQVRSMTGSAAMPTLKRLILAGHSRAYGFFDALAHAHASPQMRTGALGRPLHVWALDTTYSAPLTDWKAWLLSREDLRATVVYRHGTYRLKGSDVKHKLTTGVRGELFGKLRAVVNGRLEVMPVAADHVSHCAIPVTYLPRLLAALPAPTTHEAFEREATGEWSELGFDEDEDAVHRPVRVPGNTHAGNQPAPAKVLGPGQLLSVGSTGSAVSRLQRLLNLHPPSNLPDLAIDGVFGAATRARVLEFQGSAGLVADGIAGPQTMDALCLTLPEMEELARSFGAIIATPPEESSRLQAYNSQIRNNILALTPVGAVQGVVVVGIVIAILIVFYIAMLNLLPGSRRAHREFAQKVDQELNKLREALNLPTPMGLMSRAVESIREMVKEFIETLKRSRQDCDQSPEALQRCAKESMAVAVATQSLLHKLGELTFIGARGFKLSDLVRGILASCAALVKAYSDLGKCLNCEEIMFLGPGPSGEADEAIYEESVREQLELECPGTRTNHRVLIATPWQCQYGIRRLENVGTCPVFLLPMGADGAPLPNTHHPKLEPGDTIAHYIPPQGTHRLSAVCSNGCNGPGRLQYEAPNA